MAISERIREAMDRMSEKKPEAALIPASIAIDATAKRSHGGGVGDRYKALLHDNLALITKVGLGPSIKESFRLKYDHPRIIPGENGLCSIEQILYHAVRCGLLHEATLPSNLKFVEESIVKVEDGLLVLPASLVNGLIVAVVVAPVNKDESLPERYGITVGGHQIPANKLWGKKDKLLDLYAAMDAIWQ